MITSGYLACKVKYNAYIKGFRDHFTVYVQSENGYATLFNLKGARKAIGQCLADSLSVGDRNERIRTIALHLMRLATDTSGLGC